MSAVASNDISATEVGAEHFSAHGLRDLLDYCQAGLDRDHRPGLAPLVNWSGSKRLPIHRWFRYREGYSPRLIEELGLGSRILDPLCGSGSILVGAAETGRTAVGIDVNPLATFVARTKLTPLTARQLDSAREFSSKLRDLCSDSEPWRIPDLSIALKVFEPLILDELMRCRGALERYAPGDEDLTNFLRLSWLAILQEVGNYFKEGNGIKYRNRKRTRTGYVMREEGQWQKERFGADQRTFVRSTVLRQLDDMIQDSARWQGGRFREQRVYLGSALQASETISERQFESVIFSPPYANRFDYFESLKVEMWFGGFVTSYSDLNRLRKASVSSHLGYDRRRSRTILPELEDIIGLMDQSSSSWRMGVPDALRGYFADMAEILVQCKTLCPNGTCSVVIGNSAFASVIVPTDAFVAKIGLQSGFTRANISHVRHLTVAPQQRINLMGMQEYMRESIITFS